MPFHPVVSAGRPLAAVALLAGAAVRTAAAQGGGAIRGVAYDSLLHAPLAGAEVLVPGVGLRAVTDASGRFRLEGVPAGLHLVALSHPGLDSAGFYNIAAPVTVTTGATADVSLAVPSLATLWRRVCRSNPVGGADSGIVYGTVTDAATGNRLAGAGVVASWLELRQVSRTQVAAEERALPVLTDSIGNYSACGVGTEGAVQLHAYDARDSTGTVLVGPGARPVARQDLSVGGGAAASLQGVVSGAGGQPVARAHVTVDGMWTTLTGADGAFLLTGLPAGTRWLSIRAIGYAPVGLAVDLRRGDTVALAEALGAAAVTLDTVRVVATLPTRALREFDERRRGAGFGHFITADQIQRRPTVRAVFGGLPSVRIVSRPGGSFAVTVPSRRFMQAGCEATLYIDGIRAVYEELLVYRPSDLVGVEVYPRRMTLPLRYQEPWKDCGVVLVWTRQAR